ncbi:MAG TPA: phage terminase large subunit [Candidatus Glassbacteria bacterium]|nr:phage terminase large subunit [Candidatus Glassbacteria bacterium]
MQVVNLILSEKQEEILRVLEDDVHTEVFMGGAAGGSKSFTGCLWQILRRIRYPGSRGYLARARLKDLKASTLLTFFEVCGLLGLKLGTDYKYNEMKGVIKFANGSEEYLKDLFYYPSDPEYVSLGSTEYTDGFIDEMGDITEQAYQIIRSRMRFKLDQFKLIPKIAMGSNPCKTFIYRDFYKRWRDNELEHFKAYIPASVYDNPFISVHYIENLKKLDTKNRERLLNGNWEYDDDPTKIFDYDRIIDMFTNEARRGEKYCVVDQAGFGRDSCMVSIWEGLFITEFLQFDVGLSVEELDKILTDRQIPRSHCIVDEIGVGFGLKKGMPEIVGFVANAAPIKKKKETEDEKGTHNYKNLRSQCWFLLANHVNAGMIGIYRKLPIKIKDLIVEDLEVMKQMDVDKDTTLRVVSKQELKDKGDLNRSTDAGDVLMMRMYFEINPNEGAWAFPDSVISSSEEKFKVYGDSNIRTITKDGKEIKMVGDRILRE